MRMHCYPESIHTNRRYKCTGGNKHNIRRIYNIILSAQRALTRLGGYISKTKHVAFIRANLSI